MDEFFKLANCENGHCNFTNQYIWRKPYDIRWAEEDGILLFSAVWEGQTFGMQPVCKVEKIPAAIQLYEEFFSRNGMDFCLRGVCKKVAEYCQKNESRYVVEEDRDNFDYVYSSDDLIHLRGRKYHSKKNHLNAFWKEYPEAQYSRITPELVPACLDFLDRWYEVNLQQQPGDLFLPVEQESVKEILQDLDFFKLTGGVLLHEDKIVALTLGEMQNQEMAVIHTEKADVEYRGSYPAINQAFVEHEWADVPLINREEDMGLEGLRKAKESYRPIKMVKKYNVFHLHD